ncbi:MAG: ABC transporter permease subunit [Treponema sp.]|nr:ABC transporter permease subunit [Treponema sp.]
MPKPFKKYDKLGVKIYKNIDLYIFLVPTVLYFIVFHYVPMAGIQLAFKKYNAVLGIWRSPWIGFKQFIDFFNYYQFWQIIWNTVSLSFYQLFANTIIPFILALLINQMPSKRFQKAVQTITYAPHFISVIVLVGILYVFMSPSTGLINFIIKFFGGSPYFFFGESGAFSHVYVWSGVWQNSGYGTIIYLAALSNISPDLHEAAMVDGASKIQRIRHIDIPGILPTAIIILILNTGRIMNIGFQKAFLMQTSLNISASEIIPTYVYKAGLQQYRFEYATAVGLFNSVVNLLLIVTVNRIAKSLDQSSLW